MCLSVVNKVEAVAYLTNSDSMDVSNALKPGAGARTSRRFRLGLATERVRPVTPGADKLAKQLTKYNLHKTISAGSSCSVYIGQRAGYHVPVAVKVMSASKRSKLSKKGLVREIRCMKKLQASGKRCFPGLIESFADRYNHYIVLQYLPRGTLWTCAERAGGTLPVTLVRMMMAEVADGLLHLKKNRIIHRDIKPENLMIDLYGHIVIVDFGLALMFEDAEPEIARPSGSICGTPGYIAPELMDGKEYSYAVDVWSMGCVMFELLTGYRPYDGYSYNAFCRAVRAGNHKFPEKPRLDLHTKKFVSQLLEKNPDKRLTLEGMRIMSFFDEVDWDRVATGDYDASFYLHFTRERGVPISRTIDKGSLVDKTNIEAEWYPDSDDIQFVVPFNMTTGLLDSPQEPVYSRNKENKAEKLFYRKPYYIGKERDDYNEFEDQFRVAHPICSGGSSEFLIDEEEDDVKDNFLESVDLTTQKSTEIEYFQPPHPLLRRIPIPGLDSPPKERSRYVPRDPLDPYARQRQKFIEKYGKRPFISPPLSSSLSIDEAPVRHLKQEQVIPHHEPLIARRGLCILNIPDLVHSDSCITSASSMPVTPFDHNYGLPDDAWAPKIRRKQPEVGVGSTLRGFFKALGSARLAKFRWGL